MKERLKRYAEKKREWRKAHPLTEEQKTIKAEKLKKWQRANRDKTRAQRRRWHQKHPERASHYNRKNHYGISRHDYEQMLCRQAGRCAICERPMSNPHIDHCHDSGSIRGLLCSPCNTGIGHLQDSAYICELAATYLRRATTTLREVA